MKTCSRCKTELPATLEFFHKASDRKCGLKSACKKCSSIYRKESDKIYHIINRDEILCKQKIYRDANKEMIAESKKRWGIKNKERLNKKAVDKMNDNPMLRLKHNARNMLLRGVDGKNSRSERIIGLCWEQFNQYLQYTAIINGYDSYDGYDGHKWHIDHIRPISSFNLYNEDEYREANHWSNLQILSKTDNLKKSNRIE